MIQTHHVVTADSAVIRGLFMPFVSAEIEGTHLHVWNFTDFQFFGEEKTVFEGNDSTVRTGEEETGIGKAFKEVVDCVQSIAVVYLVP